MNTYSVKDHTFVVCAYKESPYLEDCIRSLKRQSVLGNICIATSTPNDYITDLAETYKLELFVNTNEKRGTIAYDWNFAVDCAKTSLVTLAHQDDVYGRHYLERMLLAFKHCSHPLIGFTNYYELRDGITVEKNRLLAIKRLMLSPLKNPLMWESRFVRRRILSMGSAICCPSVTIVKDNIPLPLFENNMLSNIDWQAWERISKLDGEFVYIHQPSIKHRIHGGSTTSELLVDDKRKIEDLMMYDKFWPRPVARLIEHFYQAGEKSNNL